ncbi:hypothetical protein AB0N99_21450 [Streptomyces sp. NPDC093272]|jgi:heparin binding hemagglutinin HbhA|uniref:hypothetical protein n=1 Tax=Streptomyces TaxID=1883 RepID=UPI00333464B0
MAITDDLRKTLSDPTPFYFAAGTADLALRQARKVPGLVDQLRAEAPARIDAVRNTDPKAVQEKAASRAKEAGVKAKEAQATLQARVNDFIVSLDGDLKKLGESAQDFALRQVGVAAEYAVKARETYEKVAEHGEQAVKTWRGEAADEIEDLAIAVEGKPEPVTVKADEKKAEQPKAAEAKPAPVKKAPVANAKKAPAPRKATPAKKTTPPAK